MSEAPSQAPERPIPRATYRLQFHGGFTFTDATAIIPYLAELGVSHVYASPYLQARPGSAHGYDIIDHNALNSEVGDPESYTAFCGALNDHDMGQILDFVPNHVGIGGADNRWFLDVLTWGEASPFADFFDIDWQPAKPELRGKLLVPILGDYYGTVLQDGQLRLVIDPGEDGFSVWFFEHRLPLTPGSYGRILRPAMDRMLADHPKDATLGGRLALIAAGFDELRRPARTRIARTTRAALAERLRADLKEVMRVYPKFREQVEAVIEEINGVPGDPETFRHLHQLLELQNFRLAYWRVAAEEINYRRFFQINDLAGIRVELPEVFDTVHRFIFQLIEEGKVDGLRIDHVDGLFDPQLYLESLQKRYEEIQNPDGNGDGDSELYVVVEKILAPHEALPAEWPIAGTTGYDFLNLVNGLFVNPEAELRLTEIYESFVGEVSNFHEQAYRGRKLAMEQELASELRVLANEINHLTETNWFTRDFTLVGIRQALREIVACFPVYRTYADWHGIRPEDRRYLDWAVTHGRRRSDRSELSVFDFLFSLLTTDPVRERPPRLNRREIRRLAMKFQQYTGAVMAKGVEDTAFYRYNRLVSLNEVGGEPTRFGTTLAGFHRSNLETARRRPHTMLSTATHDTKRGEDVRARINVLSELPEEWAENVQRWTTLNRRHRIEVNETTAPSENDEYLFYQVLLGAWPVEAMGEDEPDVDTLDPLRERMAGYMLKAVREAKVHSSWINCNGEYEQALTSFVERALDVRGRNPFVESFRAFAGRIAPIGVVNSLAQTVLKLTAPGVPDIYQGAELWDLNLVDPDNRRPVDFGRRQGMLRSLRHRWEEGISPAEVAGLLAGWQDGAIKLFVTWRLLQARRSLPALFRDGGYQPIEAEGPRAEHLCCFLRTDGEGWVLVVTPRLLASWTRVPDGWPVGGDVWEGTTIVVPLPAGGQEPQNILTGEPLPAGTPETDGTLLRLDVAKLLPAIPIGVWM